LFSAVSVLNKAKKAFIFAFSLIQNCTKIEEIDFYLQHIYTMFNSIKLNGSCMKSIKIIGDAIRGMELSYTKILSRPTQDERKRDNSFHDFLNISNLTTNDNKPLKRDSPFFIYYEKIIQIFVKNSNQEKTDAIEFHQNEFFCPKLFEILKSQLYLLPVWSGIIICHRKIGYDIKTRLSNNPVENWIGQLKNNILKEENIVRIIKHMFIFLIKVNNKIFL
jgi:hypothetical protein